MCNFVLNNVSCLLFISFTSRSRRESWRFRPLMEFSSNGFQWIISKYKNGIVTTGTTYLGTVRSSLPLGRHLYWLPHWIDTHPEVIIEISVLLLYLWIYLSSDMEFMEPSHFWTIIECKRSQGPGWKTSAPFAPMAKFRKLFLFNLWFEVWYQWWIQDFPERGRQPQWRSPNLMGVLDSTAFLTSWGVKITSRGEKSQSQDEPLHMMTT